MEIKQARLSAWQKLKLMFCKSYYAVDAGSCIDVCVKYKKVDGIIVVQDIGKVSEVVK